jgi:thymidylate synthase ThyX
VFPNAFNRRVLITLNLREAFHFCQLRSAPNAHFSIRRVAVRMLELIGEIYPTLASFMRCAPLPSADQITHDFFSGVAITDHTT